MIGSPGWMRLSRVCPGENPGVGVRQPFIYYRGKMSLDKAIAQGRELRKPYRGVKAIDKTCRNHGSCPACSSMRQRKNEMAEEDAIEQMKDLYDDDSNSDDQT